jgi:uncharacterized membrane protein required for colicin V production
MTWLDFLTLALCLLIMVIEVKRGAICAIIDAVGIWTALKIAAVSYRGIASAQLSNAGAYLTVFLVLVALVVVVSTLLQRQWKSDIGPFDSTVAAALGIFSGLCFSHVAFAAVFLQHGPEYQAFVESVFRSQVYELQSLKGFLHFMGRIGETDVAH